MMSPNFLRVSIFVFLQSSIFSATLVVNTNSDANTLGTFRYALSNATNGDTISFIEGIGTILLTSNLPVITQGHLQIIAPSTQVIDGDNLYRVFAIGNNSSDPVVSISNLSVVRGVAQGGIGGYSYYGGGGGGGLGAGGGLFIKGNVTLDSISISSCQAIGGGGGNSGGFISGTGQNSAGGGGGASFSSASVAGGNAVPVSQGGSGGGDGGGSGATTAGEAGGNATEISGGGGGGGPGTNGPDAIGGPGGVGLYGGGGGGAGSGANIGWAGGDGGNGGFGAGGGGSGKGTVDPQPSGGSGGILGGNGGATNFSVEPYFLGAGGGGGAGIGGAIFVYGGSSLTLTGSPLISNGTVAGGEGGTTLPSSQNGSSGTGFANGLFLDENATLVLQGTFVAGFSIDSYTSRADGGVTLTGGTVTVTQVNSYQGPTLVSGGTLIVNGSIAESSLTTVASGASLKGVGTIGRTTVEGVLRPGNSVGTLSSGPINFTPGSIYQVEIDPSGASLLNVTGAATLDGILEVIQDPGLYAPSGEYRILQTTGGITGSFASMSLQRLPGFHFILEEMNNGLFLIYSSDISTNGLSGNALSVANYLNQYGSMSTLNLLNGFSENTTKDALNSVSPARNGFGNYITQLTSFSLSNLVTDYLDTYRTKEKMTPKNASLAILFADASGEVTFPEKKHQVSGWVSGFGEYAHQKSSNQNPAFNYISEAVLGGIDYKGENVGVGGLGFGYAHTHFNENEHAGHGNINDYFISLYGNGFVGDLYFSPAIWGLFNQIKNVRNISFPGFSGKAKANIYAWQLVPHLEVGYDIATAWVEITPFFSLDWAINWQRDYREHGASPFNAKEGGKTSSMVRSESGLKLSETWNTSWGAFLLREKVSYVFEKPFHSNMTTVFVGMPSSFTVTAVNQNLNLGVIGIDFIAAFGKIKPVSINLGFEGEFGSNYWSNQVMLMINKLF